MKHYIKQLVITYIQVMLVVTALFGPAVLTAFTQKQECLWLYLITLPLLLTVSTVNDEIDYKKNKKNSDN